MTLNFQLNSNFRLKKILQFKELFFLSFPPFPFSFIQGFSLSFGKFLLQVEQNGYFRVNDSFICFCGLQLAHLVTLPPTRKQSVEVWDNKKRGGRGRRAFTPLGPKAWFSQKRARTGGEGDLLILSVLKPGFQKENENERRDKCKLLVSVKTNHETSTKITFKYRTKFASSLSPKDGWIEGEPYLWRHLCLEFLCHGAVNRSLTTTTTALWTVFGRRPVWARVLVLLGIFDRRCLLLPGKPRPETFDCLIVNLLEQRFGLQMAKILTLITAKQNNPASSSLHSTTEDKKMLQLLWIRPRPQNITRCPLVYSVIRTYCQRNQRYLYLVNAEHQVLKTASRKRT